MLHSHIRQGEILSDGLFHLQRLQDQLGLQNLCPTLSPGTHHCRVPHQSLGQVCLLLLCKEQEVSNPEQQKQKVKTPKYPICIELRLWNFLGFIGGQFLSPTSKPGYMRWSLRLTVGLSIFLLLQLALLGIHFSRHGNGFALADSPEASESGLELKRSSFEIPQPKSKEHLEEPGNFVTLLP